MGAEAGGANLPPRYHEKLQDDFDGFMLGVKEVLKASRKSVLHGVHGAVAELIRVPEKLELAMEQPLAPRFSISSWRTNPYPGRRLPS